MPKGEKYPVPAPTCRTCDEVVPYHGLGRGKCGMCGTWTHRSCLRKAKAGRNAGKTACIDCLYKEPDVDLLRSEVVEVCGLEGPDDPHITGALILMASIHWTGPDEEKVCEVTGLPPEEVVWRAENLRKQGVWKDGKIYLDLGDTPDEACVGLVLGVLVAEGMVKRAGR